MNFSHLLAGLFQIHLYLWVVVLQGCVKKPGVSKGNFSLESPSLKPLGFSGFEPSIIPGSFKG